MSIHIRINYFIILLPIIIGISFSCKHVSKTSEEVTEVKTPVTVVPVTFKPVSSTVTLPAVATFMNKNIIRATTTGTIEKILITPGEFISTDQLLFTIKTREAMALDRKSQIDSSLSFKGVINIVSHQEGVINSISYQKGDFVQEGDEMAVVSEQNSLVFIMDVPFELDKYVEKNRNCRVILPDGREIDANISRKLPDMDIQSQTIRYVVKPLSSDPSARKPDCKCKPYQIEK